MAKVFEDYQKCTDEELIERLRVGEKEIEEYLCNKYKGLVRKNARTMFILGGETDDLIQEGMIGLFKAIQNYDGGKEASFFTFADLCVQRQIYTAVQASQRKKHNPLNEAISLYSQGDGDDEGRFLLEELTDESMPDPEKLVLDRERAEELWALIEKSLTPLEKQVFELYLTKLTTSQIAKVLGREEKSTDNALQRLKQKLRKLILQGSEA